MHRNLPVAGSILALVFAAACASGSPPPTVEVGLPSPTPGGLTSEPTAEIPTATGTIAIPPTEASTAAPLTKVYAVVLVKENGALTAYASANSGSAVAGSLAWDAVDLRSTGNSTDAGAKTWVELNLPEGGTGWVDRKNLTEYVPSADFCADPEPMALFPALGMAVNTSDGSALASLVGPVHGLTIGYIHGGTPRVYTPKEVASIFTATAAVAWGLGPGSGLPVTGSFDELVRPDLINVLGGAYATACDTIQLGGASYTAAWPAEWKNINFYSLYKPGPSGQEAAWMTWLVGVDYINGLPYLFSLTRYTWEP